MVKIIDTKMSRRAVIGGGAAVAISSPALIGKAIAAGEVNWRCQSHWPKASSSFKDSLGVFKDELAKRTDGRFKIELFGSGEFAKGKEIYNIIRKGVVPMGTCSPAYILDEAQAASYAYGIPGTFRSSWEMQHVIKNLGIEALVNEDLNAKGVMYMSEKVYPTEMVVSKEIKTAGDFQGLKLRSSGTMLAYLAAAGAAPQYISGSELYQSLSSGVVDGAHWGAAIGAKSMSLWEVAKYHYRPPLGITGDGFMVNLKALESLPDDLRLIMTTLMEERFWRRSSEYQHKEAIALAAGVAENGVIVSSLPKEVSEILVNASSTILAKEAERGERAAKAADIYKSLMKDLGYL